MSNAVIEPTSPPSASGRRMLVPATPTIPRRLAAHPTPVVAWTNVERAAAFLGLQVITLRRTLERAARCQPDGSVIAHVDGITARKIGRVWRVWLDAAWRNPATTK